MDNPNQVIIKLRKLLVIDNYNLQFINCLQLESCKLLILGLGPLVAHCRLILTELRPSQRPMTKFYK